MKYSAAVVFIAATCASAFQSPAAFTRSSQSSALQMAVLSSQTGKSSLDPAVIDKYNALPFPSDQILAEYVWVDAVGNTRSKTRTLLASKVNHKLKKYRKYCHSQIKKYSHIFISLSIRSRRLQIYQSGTLMDLQLARHLAMIRK
jgi:hypothetical protein